MESISKYEIIDGYKIPKEEVEMAKIMLVNLPNNTDMVSGFRIYDGKLVMMAQSRSAEWGYDYLPVSDIVSYLKKQDISKIQAPDHKLVKGLTKIMQDIREQFKENAFRLYGFDGVCNYLKWAMKKDDKDYAINADMVDPNEVTSINLTPTEEEFERYRIKERIFGYNYGFSKSFRHYVKTEDIAQFINEQRAANKLDDSVFWDGKWCFGCNDPKKPCPYTQDTKSKRRISFDISENGEFQDYGTYKK